jgi:hypothetical protein
MDSDDFGFRDTSAFTIKAYIGTGYTLVADIIEPGYHGECGGSILVSLSNGSNDFVVIRICKASGVLRIELCSGSYKLIMVDADNCSISSEMSPLQQIH